MTNIDNQEEVAFRINNKYFLMVQIYDDGYDFTLYDDGLRDIDGGQLDNPEFSMSKALNTILDDFLDIYHLDKKTMIQVDFNELIDRILGNFIINNYDNTYNNV